MANTGKKQTAWGWIIFWFILFWPVGLILLIKRQTVDKSATLKSNKGVFIASYILMALGIIYLILAITEDPDLLAAFFVCGGGGVVVYLFARKSKLRGERYKKYIAMIVNQNQTSIDNIAAAVGVPYATAAKELQKMISAGYFIGAYINDSQREIILTHIAPQQGPSAAVVADVSQAQTMVVACPGCGANNRVVVGQFAECEYCGSPLQ